MNKFLVFPCIKQNNKDGYSGNVVMLACATNLSFVLFFPVSEENASIINIILNKAPDKLTIDDGIIGVYKTMLNAWTASDRFLSGIVMDAEIDPKDNSEVISVKLIVADENGAVDSVVKINFINAVILAAIDRKEILVTSEVIEKLTPRAESEEIREESETPAEDVPQKTNNEIKFPVDKEILNIAKQIMNGKIK